MSILYINKLLYAEISIIGIAFTSILMTKSIPKEGIRAISRQQKVFIALLLSLIVIFILDGVTWFIDGMSFKGIKELYSICLIFYFALNPILGFLWNIYVNTKIHTNIIQIKKRMRLYMIPFIINAILCITSPLTGWIFKIDETGIYSRGVLYYLNVAVSFIYYILYIICDYIVNSYEKKRASSNE